MSNSRKEGSPGATEGGAGGAGNYLFMTSPSPHQAGQNGGSGGGGGHSQFDFDHFAPKLRRVDEKEAGDSVEMRPMLANTPSPTLADGSVNAFSNPNYQNPPAFARPVLNSSDLDDPPPPSSSSSSQQAGQAVTASSGASLQHYVNLPQTADSTNSSAHPQQQADEELHYVSPKNNSRIL